MSCGAGKRPPRPTRIIEEPRELEYWLLELAIKGRIPLCFLLAKEFGPIFNVSFTFESAALLSGLERLLGAGDIEIFHKGGKPTELDHAALEEALERPAPPPPRPRGPRGPFYGLTPQGGARWETWAGAEWEKYNPLRWSTDSDDVLHGEITALDRGRAEMYLAGVRNYPVDHAYEGPEEWDLLIPWEATYWKTLVRGHRVRFRARVLNALRLTPDPPWFTAFLTWYERPFPR